MHAFDLLCYTPLMVPGILPSQLRSLSKGRTYIETHRAAGRYLAILLGTSSQLVSTVSFIMVITVQCSVPFSVFASAPRNAIYMSCLCARPSVVNTHALMVLDPGNLPSQLEILSTGPNLHPNTHVQHVS